MPIDVRNAETQVDIEPSSATGANPAENDAVKAMQRWEDMAREHCRRERRTSAWGFDD
jgi:hypothetical protein